MELQRQDVDGCLAHAKNMREEYQRYTLNPDPKKSIDDLLYIIEQVLGRRATLHELDFDDRVPETIKAVFFLTPNGYEIYLVPGLDDATRRFVLCKELFHVVLDEERCRSTDVVALVEDVCTSIWVDEAKPKTPAAFEHLAEIAAMEFLFPYKDRVTLTPEESENGGAAALADRYGIPAYLIETYCSDHYIEVFSSFA